LGEPLTYAAAGVDIAAGERAVDLIRPMVEMTRRPEVIGGIGGFGGLFALVGKTDPVLVAATDGVGTKLEVARQAGRFDTVGIDLVAMCVDDLVCQGAEPLFFLDYVVADRLEPEQIRAIVAGVAEGCRQAGAALLGGEMAEHPGVMVPGSVDLAGFAVGVVERDRIPTGARAGDVLIGLHSPGLRSNGYSLVRAIVAQAGLDLDGPAWPGAEQSLTDELLVPSVIYAPTVLRIREQVEIHGVAHITGGGLPGNIPRMIRDGATAVIDWGSWPVPRIFDELIRHGGVEEAEARRVFNLGLGMVLAVPDPAAALAALGAGASVVGRVVAA
jgi:phosphoribosylformylglycinamidine cyclo-ligase